MGGGRDPAKGAQMKYSLKNAHISLGGGLLSGGGDVEYSIAGATIAYKAAYKVDLNKFVTATAGFGKKYAKAMKGSPVDMLRTVAKAIGISDATAMSVAAAAREIMR